MAALNVGEVTAHYLDPIYLHTDTCTCGQPFDLEHLADVAAEELGIQLRRSARRAMAPQFVAQVLDLYGRGYSDGQIGRELGVNRKSIYALRRRRGLPANIAPSRRQVAA